MQYYAFAMDSVGVVSTEPRRPRHDQPGRPAEGLQLHLHRLEPAPRWRFRPDPALHPAGRLGHPDLLHLRHARWLRPHHGQQRQLPGREPELRGEPGHPGAARRPREGDPALLDRSVDLPGQQPPEPVHRPAQRRQADRSDHDRPATNANTARWNTTDGQYENNTGTTAATPVNEGNIRLNNATPDYNGIRYVFNVLDTVSPDYSTARGLVGFDNVAAGAKSPMCSNSKRTTILSFGFAPLSTTGGGATNLAGSSCRYYPPACSTLGSTGSTSKSRAHPQHPLTWGWVGTGARSPPICTHASHDRSRRPDAGPHPSAPKQGEHVVHQRTRTSAKGDDDVRGSHHAARVRRPPAARHLRLGRHADPVADHGDGHHPDDRPGRRLHRPLPRERRRHASPAASSAWRPASASRARTSRTRPTSRRRPVASAPPRRCRPAPRTSPRSGPPRRTWSPTSTSRSASARRRSPTSAAVPAR